ncbi:hypothetical protein JCM10212_000740 [Sporobolomyces blumeae]
MVSALHVLSYVTSVIGVVFILLSLASGLLYIAEIIEEHTATAKAVGKRLIHTVIVLFLVLYLVDGLPLHLVSVGIAAHLVYLTNFRRSWPSISLSSLSFLASCFSVLLSHYLSFRHFSAKQSSSKHHYTRYNAYNHRRGAYGAKQEEGFFEVATFFAVCVWLVPFYLFLSLSANDNVLPSAGETSTASRRASAAAPNPSTAAPSSPTLQRHARQRSSMMKTAISSVFSIVPSPFRPHALSSSSGGGGGGTGSRGVAEPVSTGGSSGSNDRLLRSPSPTIGFQPFAGRHHDKGGNSTQREGLLISSSPKSASFFGSGTNPTGPWTGSSGSGVGGGGVPNSPTTSQPNSPSMGAFPSRFGNGGSQGSPEHQRGLGFGIGNGPSSPALRAMHHPNHHPHAPPGMPPRRHTTQADEGSFVHAVMSSSPYGGSSASALGRSASGIAGPGGLAGGVGSGGPVKRRGTGESSNLR